MKPWFKSKTILYALVAIIALIYVGLTIVAPGLVPFVGPVLSLVLNAAGIPLPVDEVSSLAGVLVGVLAAIGAIKGRVDAAVTIGK